MRLKIRIELMEVDNPKVWREMWIPMHISFETFHTMLQVGMGWEDLHLYSFQESLESKYFHIMCPPFDDLPGIDATAIKINNILWEYYNSYLMSQRMDINKNADKLYYIYDFGDVWEHEIYVVDFDPTPVQYAEITDGGGACPPEDCGGVSGYQRTKKYLDGKIDKVEYYDWFSAVNAEGLDVHHFDIKMQNRMLKTML